MADKIAKVTLVALDEALASLDEANASETMDKARGHISRAVSVLDRALRYAQAIALEVDERKKPPN